MGCKIRIKRKVDGVWAEIEMPSGCFADILRSFDGGVVVVEVDTGRGLSYFCGTDHLVSLMQNKGASILCRDAAVFYAAGQEQRLYDVAEVFFPKKVADNCLEGENKPSIKQGKAIDDKGEELVEIKVGHGAIQQNLIN